MKKLLFTLILTFVSTGAMAEWNFLRNGDGGLKAYADLSSIRKTDNGMKVWVMVDYTTIQGNGKFKHLSTRVFKEFDCKDKRERSLSVTLFKGNMTDGDITYTTNNSNDWGNVIPNTIDAEYMSIACGKK